MADNVFDQFDEPKTKENPFDKFDGGHTTEPVIGEGGAAFGVYPENLPKREKGYASGVVSGLTGEKGPSLMQQTENAKQFRKGQEVGEPVGLGVDLAMTAVPVAKAGGAAIKGGKTLADWLSLGKTSRSLAEDLRSTGTKTAGSIAKTSGAEMTAAEQRAAIARTAQEKAERGSEGSLRPLSGVSTEMEAGRFKPVAQTEQDIGTRIKDSADKTRESLKAKRDANAKELKQKAFGEAYRKESTGQDISSTKAYKNALEEIDKMIKNPTTGLSNAPVVEIESQLKKIRGMLDRRYVNPLDGEVIVRPKASFEGLEGARRFLRDRSFGVPAEGYDAISQQIAGRLADKIEAIMVEFSPDIKTFLNQYKKDSEPLRVFQSKVGKALTGEQLQGTGSNFATVNAQDIPKKVFGSRENYDALIDAFGGNKQLAEAEAKKYFASQLEGVKSAKDVENFIRKNRAMLKETNALPMAEKYATDLRKFENRATSAKDIAKSETKTAEQKAQLTNDYMTFESNLEIAANDPAKIVSTSQQFAKKMLADGKITQAEYRELATQIDKVKTMSKDAEAMKNQLKTLTFRALGFGLVSAVGGYAVGEALK